MTDHTESLLNGPGLSRYRFSAYMIALVERDRALGESRRFLHDLEAGLMLSEIALRADASAENTAGILSAGHDPACREAP